MTTLKPIRPIVAWLFPAETAPVPVPPPVPTPTPVPAPTPSTGAFVAVTPGFGANFVFQRDVDRGTPAGFDPAVFSRGYGTVKLTINPAAAYSVILAMLYDADSAGADPAKPGTGTALTSKPVQIVGAVKAGQQSITASLPFSPYLYLLDISQDGTNWTRIPVPFGVGEQIGAMTRSQNCGAFGHPWAYTTSFDAAGNYTGDAPADLSKMVPFTKGLALVTEDGSYGIAGNAWTRHDGKPGWALSPSGVAKSSSGLMELCRYMGSRLGGLIGVAGIPGRGGNMNNAFEGTGVAGRGWDRTMATAGSKFRFFAFSLLGGNFSVAHYRRDIPMLCDYLDRTYPGVPIIKALNVWTGWGDGSGSANWGGYGRLNALMREELAAKRSDVVALDAYDWNRWYGGHATMLSKVRSARRWAQALLSKIDPAVGGLGPAMGPKLRGIAQRDPGSRVIRLPFDHDGGKKLLAYAWMEPASTINGVPYHQALANVSEGTVAPTADLLKLFALRLAGHTLGYGRTDTRGSRIGWWGALPGSALVKLSDVTFDNQFIYLTIDPSNTFLDGTPLPLSDDTDFSLCYAIDFQPCDWTPGAVFLDDNADPDHGIPYGRLLQPRCDIYVPKPKPAVAAPTISINSPATTVAGGFVSLSGPPGSGPALNPAVVQANAAADTGLQVTIDGGAPSTPLALMLRQDNSWLGYGIAPMTEGDHTLTLSPGGTTAKLKVASRATLLRAPPAADQAFIGLSEAAAGSYVESYCSANHSTLHQNADGTGRIIADMTTIRAWDGESGNRGNRLVQASTNPQAPPVLDLSPIAAPWDILYPQPNVVFEGGVHGPNIGNSIATGPTPPLAAQLAGDFTILCVCRQQDAFGLAYWLWQISAGSGGVLGMGAGRTSDFIRGAQALNVPAGTLKLNQAYSRTLVRYSAATGLLEAFSPDVTAPMQATTVHSPLTLGALSFALWWGNLHLWMAFASAFSDTDKAAALTYLNNAVPRQ